MKRFLFAALLALGLGATITAAPAQAHSPWVRGVVFHPQLGNLVYLHNRATGYVYFPALGRGGYLPAPAGVPRRPASRPSGGLPFSSSGSVIGGPGGAVGYISGGTGVTFGPGGPTYSSSR